MSGTPNDSTTQPDARTGEAAGRVIEARAPQYLTLVEEGDTFEFRFDDFADTVFDLRIVPDALHKQFVRQHTKIKFERGNRHEITDWDAVGRLSITYAIRNVRGLKKKTPGSNTSAAVAWSDLSEDQRAKLIELLPERCKADMLRQCVGKEIEAAGGEKKP